MRIKTITLLALFIFSLNANASLIGDEVSATWKVDGSTVISETFVVDNGVELNGTWASAGFLNVQDTSINIDFNDSTGLAAVVTWEFTSLDFSGTPGGISNVTVNTNYVGWQNSFLSFTDDSIFINFTSDVTYNNATDYFDIQITAVPLPASLWLFTSGLISLIALRRRKHT